MLTSLPPIPGRAKKIRGFLHEASLQLKRQPGMSAQEVVRLLLKSGRVRSASQNPELSLVATLHKHYRDVGLERRKDGPVYRFYPQNGGAELPPTSNHVAFTSGDDNVEVSIRLPRNRADIVDALIGSGKFKDRDEVVNWLVEKGIESLRL